MNTNYLNGFYKNDGGNLLYAPTYVINKDYELHIEQYNTYNYPISGWYYFNTLQEACNLLQLDITPYLPVSDNS